MQLFIRICKKYKHIFFLTIILILVIGFFWQLLQKEFVMAEVTLNVTRLSSEKTSDYQYHDFYRLQADERFADTIVRWIETPRMMADTYGALHIAPVDTELSWPVRHTLTAERLSSQMIRVRYPSRTETEARAIAQSLTDHVNTMTAALNKDQKEAAWFTVVHDEPISQDGRVSMVFVLALSGLLGVFFGFWLILLAHYFSASAVDHDRR